MNSVPLTLFPVIFYCALDQAAQLSFHGFRYDTANGDPCSPRSSKKKHKAVLAVAVVVPVVIVVILISAMLMLLFWKKQGRHLFL